MVSGFYLSELISKLLSCSTAAGFDFSADGLVEFDAGESYTQPPGDYDDSLAATETALTSIDLGFLVF